VLKELAAMLKRKFKERTEDTAATEISYAFNPQVQYFFKASLTDDIYQYSADYCTDSERKKFIKEAIPSATQHMDIAECW